MKVIMFNNRVNRLAKMATTVPVVVTLACFTMIEAIFWRFVRGDSSQPLTCEMNYLWHTVVLAYPCNTLYKEARIPLLQRSTSFISVYLSPLSKAWLFKWFCARAPSRKNALTTRKSWKVDSQTNAAPSVDGIQTGRQWILLKRQACSPKVSLR